MIFPVTSFLKGLDCGRHTKENELYSKVQYIQYYYDYYRAHFFVLWRVHGFVCNEGAVILYRRRVTSPLLVWPSSAKVSVLLADTID